MAPFATVDVFCSLVPVSAGVDFSTVALLSAFLNASKGNSVLVDGAPPFDEEAPVVAYLPSLFVNFY